MVARRRLLDFSRHAAMLSDRVARDPAEFLSDFELDDALSNATFVILASKLRAQAATRIARTGLALLVVRSREGDWPADLAGVRSVLPSNQVLIDPYTGNEISYELTATGIALSCAGFKGVQQGQRWEIRD